MLKDDLSAEEVARFRARPALTGWAGGQGPFAWAGTWLDGATHAARARGIDAKWLVCFLH